MQSEPDKRLRERDDHARLTKPRAKGLPLGPFAPLAIALGAVIAALVPMGMLGTGPSEASTPVPGIISGNVTWDVSGSPYLIGQDTVLETNSSLTISAGVEVRFEGVWKLTSFGLLTTRGFEGREVRFVQNRSDAQTQFVIIGMAGSLDFSAARIEEGRLEVRASARLIVDGLAITCRRPTCDTAIALRGTTGTTIRRISIVQAPTSPSPNPNGLEGSQLTGLLMDSFSVFGGTPEGIDITGCDACLLSNGTLDGLATKGVELWGNGSAIRNLRLIGGYQAVLIVGDRNLVQDNHVEAPGVGVSVIGAENRIESNVLERPQFVGVHTLGTATIVRSNRVSGAGVAGIHLSIGGPVPSSGVSVLDNLVEESGYGVLSEQPQGVFRGNTFRSNGVGTELRGSSNRVDHNHFEFNNLQGRDVGSGNAWDDGYPSGGNWWSDYVGVDLYSGPMQSTPGSDGFGDTARPVSTNGVDRYPFYTVLAPSAPREITARGSGTDVVVTWVPQPGPNADRFLVYRAPSQVGFDFASPVAIVTGTTWLDVGANTVDGHAYYTVRALNSSIPAFSTTGNTAGVWRHAFPPGKSTFSLPLIPYPWVDYAQPGWTDTVAELAFAIGLNSVDYMEGGRWRLFPVDGEPTTPLEIGRGYAASSQGTRRFTFTGIPASMIAHCGFPPCPGTGFDATGEARNLSASVVGNNVIVRWPGIAGFFLADRYEIRAARSPAGVLGDPGVDYTSFVVTPSMAGQQSFSHSGAAAVPGIWYYLIVPLQHGAWRGSSSYSIGVWIRATSSGYEAIGLPLLPWNGGVSIPMDASDLVVTGVSGIQWFDLTRQDWVAHASWMPPGTYDTPLSMVMAVQIHASVATRIAFVGV